MAQPRRGFRSTQTSRPFTGRLAGGVVEKRGGGRGDACMCVCVRASAMAHASGVCEQRDGGTEGWARGACRTPNVRDS